MSQASSDSSTSPVAKAMDLGFLPVADEHYDFAVWQDPRDPQAMAAFQDALAASTEALTAMGFAPASGDRP